MVGTVQCGCGDVFRGAEFATLEGDTDGVYSVSFSPDGSILASGGRDGIVRFVGRVFRSRLKTTLRGHEGSVRSVFVFLRMVPSWPVVVGDGIVRLLGRVPQQAKDHAQRP